MPGIPLVLEERVEIQVGVAAGESFAAIGRRLGRASSTISREVMRNGRRRRYAAVRAQLHTVKRCRRPKVPKLVRDAAMAAVVERDLRLGFSPAGVSARLRQHGGPTVCTETIYQALYSREFRGLKLLPHQCLRTRRRRRRVHGRSHIKPGWRKEINLIGTRPACVADRSQAGHWEGDLIIGTHCGSAMITLVERVSRLTVLTRLEGRHDSFDVIHALIGEFETIPTHLRRSLTWDQGAEMSRWPDLQEALDLPVYFCNPRSPWERPSNENTNRQLRYWFPKGTDLRTYDQNALDRATNILNNQPRRLFNWDTAAQRYHQLAVH